MASKRPKPKREIMEIFWKTEVVQEPDGAVTLKAILPLFHMSRRQAAKALGCSESTITDLYRLGLLILVPLMVVAQWITASGTSCPLCRTAVLAPKLCMKHRRARPLFGSYRLRVAGSILVMNQFRCPYCDESTAMEPRLAQR